MRDTIKLLWKQSFCIPVSNLKMQKMLKSIRGYFDADQNLEMIKRMDDLQQFCGNNMIL